MEQLSTGITLCNQDLQNQVPHASEVVCRRNKLLVLVVWLSGILGVVQGGPVLSQKMSLGGKTS
jgi:hypothetical protein